MLRIDAIARWTQKPAKRHQLLRKIVVIDAAVAGTTVFDPFSERSNTGRDAGPIIAIASSNTQLLRDLTGGRMIFEIKRVGNGPLLPMRDRAW